MAAILQALAKRTRRPYGYPGWELITLITIASNNVAVRLLIVEIAILIVIALRLTVVIPLTRGTAK